MTDPTLIATQVYRNGGLEPLQLAEAIALTATDNNLTDEEVSAMWMAKVQFIRAMVAHGVLKPDNSLEAG